MKRLFYLFCLMLVLFNSAFTEEKFIEIKAKKFDYDPNIIKVHKGDTVHVRLISLDVTHGFYLDGYDINTSAFPGSDGSLTFIADKTGRFTFRCSTPCGEHHPYMVGYLEVGPNKRFYFYVFLTLVFAAGSVLTTFSLFKFKKQGKEEENGEG
ncbi:MAG: cupredoxin domain-containing protein [bacterium]|nr:cupredoxin domain-containing protein [bacterium]